MNHLVIRADASSKRGTGHVMRCLALAQAWRDGGGRVHFLSQCESRILQSRLAEEGFELSVPEGIHPDPRDREHTMRTLNEVCSSHSSCSPWLVIDGYHFDAAYQKHFKDAGCRLLWIDDYGHAEHYCADYVLNQNITARESLYLHREQPTRLLMGVDYALLRREFLGWKEWVRDIPQIGRRVLVTFGGGDDENAALKVVRAMKKVNVTGLEAKIVVGPAHPNRELLQKEASKTSFVEAVSRAPNMPELMAWADLAVFAGGSTSWEAAFFGLPGIIMYFAENQRPIAEKLHETGSAFTLGRSADLTVESIARAIQDTLLSQERRAGHSKQSRALVDGLGALRVCEVLKSHSAPDVALS